MVRPIGIGGKLGSRVRILETNRVSFTLMSLLTVYSSSVLVSISVAMALPWKLRAPSIVSLGTCLCMVRVTAPLARTRTAKNIVSRTRSMTSLTLLTRPKKLSRKLCLSRAPALPGEPVNRSLTVRVAVLVDIELVRCMLQTLVRLWVNRCVLLKQLKPTYTMLACLCALLLCLLKTLMTLKA